MTQDEYMELVLFGGPMTQDEYMELVLGPGYAEDPKRSRHADRMRTMLERARPEDVDALGKLCLAFRAAEKAFDLACKAYLELGAKP